ncbi:unnamed protein product, partial [Didymodactylos carnosus]
MMKRRLSNDTSQETKILKLDQTTAKNDERLELFKKWLDENNVIYQNVDICQSSFGYSLRSKIEIASHTHVIQIPKHVLMYADCHFQQETSILFRDVENLIYDQIDKETFYLTLFLLEERLKGNESFWYPYLNLLPKHFTTPLFFTDEQLDNYLELTSPYHMARTMKESMKDVYELIPAAKFNLHDFLWAYTVISSRAFKLKL